MIEYSIPQSKIAEKIEMKESTFKLKFSEKHPKYKFKPSEIIKILEVLDELTKKLTILVA